MKTRNRTYYDKMRIVRLLSAVCMFLLLSFITSSNIFVYGIKKQVTTSMEDSKPLGNNPSGTDEEKAGSNRALSNINEEYLHEHDLLDHPAAITASNKNLHTRLIDLGTNYAWLHAQPPDA